MWYHSIVIDEQGLLETIEDLTTRINSFSRKRNPFRVVVQQEQLNEEAINFPVVRFYLVLTPDFAVKNERQAWQFCQKMQEAAQEIADMNDWNYCVAPEPNKRPMGGGMRHA